jgi:hypothetical protein
VSLIQLAGIIQVGMRIAKTFLRSNVMDQIKIKYIENQFLVHPTIEIRKQEELVLYQTQTQRIKNTNNKKGVTEFSTAMDSQHQIPTSQTRDPSSTSIMLPFLSFIVIAALVTLSLPSLSANVIVKLKIKPFHFCFYLSYVYNHSP